MMKVVIMGGGHGLSAILRGIKHIDNIQITAIVSVADDGGSTGHLRERFHIPAVGDIRSVIVALAESETLLSDLMNYRFDKNEDGVSHSLGNLMITALMNMHGGLMEAILVLSQVLNVQGQIVPASLDYATLVARMEDGTKVVGESNIPAFNNVIDHVYYQEKISGSKEAVTAIEEADLIVFGIGSLYTSIIPNAIIPELQEAINQSKALKLYLCNVMTESGETDGFSVCDHVRALEQHLRGSVDLVAVANDKIPEEILQKYRKHMTQPVYFEPYTCHNKIVIEEELLSFDEGVVRHDPLKIKYLFERIIGDYDDLCQRCEARNK